MWTRLADTDANMKQTLERLHGLFVNAPDLGSLINPTERARPRADVLA